jgi:hypothetical protein
LHEFLTVSHFAGLGKMVKSRTFAKIKPPQAEAQGSCVDEMWRNQNIDNFM